MSDHFWLGMAVILISGALNGSFPGHLNLRLVGAGGGRRLHSYWPLHK
jgi:hypothetical protein